MSLNLNSFANLKQTSILIIAIIFIYLFSVKIGNLELRYLIVIPSLVFFTSLINKKFIVKDYNAFKASFLLG